MVTVILFFILVYTVQVLMNILLQEVGESTLLMHLLNVLFHQVYNDIQKD